MILMKAWGTSQKGLIQLGQSYIDEAIKHAENIVGGSKRQANKAARKLIRIRSLLLQAGEEGREIMLGLMEHENPFVRGWAAADSLALEPERALHVLEQLQSLPGLVGLNAEFTLKTWREKQKR